MLRWTAYIVILCALIVFFWMRASYVRSFVWGEWDE